MTSHQQQAGFSYLEALLAVGLLAVSLVPMLEVLQTALLAGQVHETVAAAEHRAMSRMEEVLAEPFAALDAAAQAAASETVPSSYSDPAATPGRRLVYLSRYDGDNDDADNQPFTGTDEGLIWIRVEIENTVHSFEALTAQ